MKNFFASLLGTLVGFIIGLVGLVLLFFVGIAILLSAAKEKTVPIKENSVYHLQLHGNIVDRADDNPFQSILTNRPPDIGLNEVLRSIAFAKRSNKIRGIYLDVGFFRGGVGTVEEIRKALLDFRKSGKFIYAHGDFYTQKGYYLATAADEIYLTPTGGIDLRGLSAEVLFFKGFLKKIGLTAHVIRHGEFKSAVEPFMLDKMSDANRKQMKAYVGSIWDYMVGEIALSRNIAPEKLDSCINDFVGLQSEVLQKEHIVDSLIYKDEFQAIIRTKIGISEKGKIQLATTNMLSQPRGKKKSKIKNRIAVVYASGSIVNGRSSEEGIIASETFAEAIRDARNDSDVKAVVLRVNSGGGSALASEVIWREMELTKKEKPVVVSMGDIAASGGYYIACNADAVLAHPTTITGSIGVFGILFSGKNLLNDKLGITTDGIKTNKYADLASFNRPMRIEERMLIKRSIEKTYDVFIGRVADGRSVTKEKVDSIGEGRVWSGINAMEIGLIDEFGGLTDAIDLAAEKAGIHSYKVRELPEKPDPIEALLTKLSTRAKVKEIEALFNIDLSDIRDMQLLIDNPGIQMRIPYSVDIQ